MQVRWRRTITGVIVGACTMLTAYAQSEVRARVSFDEGGTVLRGVDDSDWAYATTNTIVLPGDTLWVRERGSAEIEMSAGNFLRMADGSNVVIESLPPNAAVRASAGSVYVQRLNRTGGTITVNTPSCAVRVEPDTCVRLDILDNGGTTVSVRWGAAGVRVGNSELQRINPRERVYVDAGYLPSRPVLYNTAEEDDFDAWNRERAEFMVTGVSRVPDTVPIADSTIGYSELSSYGDWEYIDGRSYWRPTYVSDYVPYRYGHWSYVRQTGHCWVDDYPFGYVTSHYGRWQNFPRYGWCWSYDPVWSPAWVATVRYGSNFLWAPVDYYNRPVVVSASATFDIGGVAFSFAASTFVPQEHLYYGGSYIAPVRPAIVQNINVTNINIWNINEDSRRLAVNVPFKNKDLKVYNYRPDKVVRGRQKLARLASNESARDVAAKLETSRAPKKARAEAKAARIAEPSPTPETVEKERRKVKLDTDQRETRPKIARELRSDRDRRDRISVPKESAPMSDQVPRDLDRKARETDKAGRDAKRQAERSPQEPKRDRTEAIAPDQAPKARESDRERSRTRERQLESVPKDGRDAQRSRSDAMESQSQQKAREATRTRPREEVRERSAQRPQAAESQSQQKAREATRTTPRQEVRERSAQRPRIEPGTQPKISREAAPNRSRESVRRAEPSPPQARAKAPGAAPKVERIAPPSAERIRSMERSNRQPSIAQRQPQRREAPSRGQGKAPAEIEQQNRKKDRG